MRSISAKGTGSKLGSPLRLQHALAQPLPHAAPELVGVRDITRVYVDRCLRIRIDVRAGFEEATADQRKVS